MWMKMLRWIEKYVQYLIQQRKKYLCEKVKKSKFTRKEIDTHIRKAIDTSTELRGTEDVDDLFREWERNPRFSWVDLEMESMVNMLCTYAPKDLKEGYRDKLMEIREEMKEATLRDSHSFLGLVKKFKDGGGWS